MRDRMTDRLGTIFVNEIPLPISKIYLAEGQIKVEMVIDGPFTLPEDGTELRLHGIDGKLVTMAHWRLPSHWQKNHRRHTPAGRSVTIVLPLEIMTKAAVGWPS
jgi:hypothetical protein